MIVVFSHAKDVHAAAVLDRLRSWGHRVHLFDVSDLPTRATLTMDYRGARPAVRLRDHEGGVVDLSQATAVWWRRPQDVDLGSIADATARTFCYSEWYQAIHGMHTLLPGTWMNPVDADLRASHKPLQLAVAPDLGLAVPATLMTSDADEAAGFIDEFGVGAVIYKIFCATHEVWRETRVLAEADLGLLGQLRWAPVIFQEYVPAVMDVRVTIVGDDMFAMGIDARGTGGEADFRLALGRSTTSAVPVPDDVAAGLRALMAHFGIVYGGADFRVTPDGEWVFLEINPAGEFLFCEHGAGLPLTDAVASWLANPVGHRTRVTCTTSEVAAAVTG